MESGGEDGIIPIPYPLPIGEGVSLLRILDGIIDDGDIYGSTRQRSADTNRLIESPMTDRLEHIDIPEISLDIVLYER